jgi:hypothetical protein
MNMTTFFIGLFVLLIVVFIGAVIFFLISKWIIDRNESELPLAQAENVLPPPLANAEIV